MTVTLKRLREVLSYDGATGEFVWIKPPHVHPRLAGNVAGGFRSGYLLIKIDGRKYGAHRLAWFYTHGRWPVDRIDHISTLR